MMCIMRNRRKSYDVFSVYSWVFWWLLIDWQGRSFVVSVAMSFKKKLFNEGKIKVKPSAMEHVMLEFG